MSKIFKVCDGIQDCPNGSDEKSCNCTWSSSCPVLLPNGKLKCIEPSQICNGFIDCPAGEDENNCMKCSADSAFKCKNQTKCIPPTAKCDGRNDCLDGSDEEDCTSDECAIHPFPMYLCSNRRNCVRKTEACSPFSTCPNRTVDDERYCSNFLDSEVFKTIL
uniref:Uncharacterized protein n=1 Tax=Panagrolaimus superbus TaxID=310955 RepID=A0A914Z0X9_9BILA